MNTTRKCPTCGATGTLKDGTTEHTETVGSRVFVAALPARVCENCGESLVADRGLEAFERARTRALVAEGVSDGRALLYLRKAARPDTGESARVVLQVLPSAA